MIGGAGRGRELRVGMHHIEHGKPGLGWGQQVIADQNVIEHLGVAVVDVADLLSRRQRRDQIGQHAALEDCQRRGELEVVDVAQRHDVGAGVESQDGVYEVVDDLRLLVCAESQRPARAAARSQTAGRRRSLS